jgi:microcompartment protein CcmK/EutM
MILGKVVGTVVASRKEGELVGLKLLSVAPIDPQTGALKGSGVVAVDAVGAGVGEVVLYASGSSARQTTVTKDRPVDATIMAIVDMVDVAGQVIYDKAAPEAEDERAEEQGG